MLENTPMLLMNPKPDNWNLQKSWLKCNSSNTSSSHTFNIQGHMFLLRYLDSVVSLAWSLLLYYFRPNIKLHNHFPVHQLISRNYNLCWNCFISYHDSQYTLLKLSVNTLDIMMKHKVYLRWIWLLFSYVTFACE